MAKGSNGKVLTDRGLTALKPGEWAFDPAPRGAGQLQVRRLAAGELSFYFRYTSIGDKRDRVVIGTGLTLAEARAEAAKLSKRYQAGDRDLRAALDAEEREKQRTAEAKRAAQESKAKATLGALLLAYCDSLERAEKVSHRLVRGTLERHVKNPWPKLWAKPAAEVETDDLLDVVARVHDAKGKNDKPKLREAAKLRSYLRAAYAAAIRARQSPQALPALRALKLSRNPASDLVTIEGSSTPGERFLSVAELRSYWKHIAAMPGAPGAALRFHLLTGAQRVKQLARLTTADHDHDLQTVRLYDRKGRRTVPRKHDVPLIQCAQDAIAVMRGDEPTGAFLLTFTRGATAATYESFRDHVATVRTAMAEAGELEKGDFTVGDLRRSVETQLSTAKISQEDLAQLQSHGLGGVQSRYYNRNTYMDAKRSALEVLFRLVSGTSATVTSISKRKRASK